MLFNFISRLSEREKRKKMLVKRLELLLQQNKEVKITSVETLYYRTDNKYKLESESVCN